MRTKLSLEELKVKSFQTSKNEIKGGTKTEGHDQDSIIFSKPLPCEKDKCKTCE